MNFTELPYWDFFKGGQPLILVKNQKLIICLFLDKMDIKIMFDDHLVKEQALLAKKNIDFT